MTDAGAARPEGGMANRRGPRPRTDGTKRGPLRKIIGAGVGIDPTLPLVRYEVLECGHFQLPVQDLMGETRAYRRRCRKCKRGSPPDVPKPESRP